ncbi:MAG: 2Fe-2S iron-sulfur cluster-binding protein [Hyphomonadaceae bacterium]
MREPNSRGGSITVHDTLQVGQTLEISAPRNHFPLDPTKGRRVLLAGGIGITPILSMAHQSLREGCSFAMHYCARTAAKMAFTKRIKQSAIAPYCIFHLDDGPDPQKLDMGAALANPAQSDQLYVCGPAGFIEAALTSATANGWREPQVHREFFSAPATERDASADEAFTVVLARLGLNVLVPSGVSIVEALEAEGVSVPTSCAEGICGMCVVPVLEGTPEHRDFVLTDDEHARNDRITACCSRSKTPILVLDL